MDTALIIGLDSSTTACKALGFDTTGQIVAEGRAALPVLKPRPSWHEQPAQSWWQAACTALKMATRSIDISPLAGLAISIQRETFVLLDQHHQPLENALVWMDERAGPLMEEIRQHLGASRVHQETGKPLSANLTLAKLYWLSHHRPDLAAQTRLVADVHAYLTLQLTGQAMTSWGCADPTGLFDMQHNRWHADLIEKTGFHVDQLPAAFPSGQVIGHVSAQAAQECGLPVGLPVIAGTGDGQAAGLGVNAARPGETYLNLGTAVVSGTCAPRYLTAPAFRTHYSGITPLYAYETVLLGGTYTISWYLEKFGQPGLNDEASCEAAAREIPAGAEGLTLVPYWNSAMNPYWDPTASGIVVGWRGIHGPAHFYRAILEGIAYELRLSISGVEAALAQPAERLIAVGGGAKSSLWLQIIADVTGKPVYRSGVGEASALGAAVLAAAGCGLFASAQQAAAAMTRIDPLPVLPDEGRHAFYTRRYEDFYRHLFPALQPYLQRLAEQ